MSEETSTSSAGPRRRRRGGRRYSSDRPRNRSSEGRTPRKPQNPVVAFFKRIFGLTTAAEPTRRPERGHSERPERKERAERPQRSETRSEPRAERSERHERKSSGETSSADEKSDVTEITIPKLYIGNLSYDASESDLFDLFSTIGAVKNVEIARDRNSNSKGFGFVEMSSIEAARELAGKFHRTQFMDRQLVVTGARKP
jgi:hypothetical protein